MNNDRAFPSNEASDQNGGMTLRDWFASVVSHENLPLPETVKECAAILGIEASQYDNRTDWLRIVAKYRYQYADAMLAEREKQS